MWRDPYRRSWGESAAAGLLGIIVVFVAANFVVRLLEPLVPVVVGALALLLVVGWMFGRRHY